MTKQNTRLFAAGATRLPFHERALMKFLLWFAIPVSDDEACKDYCFSDDEAGEVNLSRASPWKVFR